MRKYCTYVALLSSFALAGCAAVWGQSYHVEYADSHSVIIKYDTSIANYGAMQKEAQENCSKYNKDADEIYDEDMGGFGMRTLKIHCIKKNLDRDNLDYIREHKRHHSESLKGTIKVQ